MLKRIYLLSGVVLSLLLPLVTLHYRVELPAPLMQETQVMTAVLSSPTAAEIVEETDPLKWFMIFYAAGILFMLGRTMQYLFTVYRVVRSRPAHREGEALLIRSEKYTSAFSFFNYVFINPSVSEREAREILNHELVHLKQKHWFDLLLVEMMSLIQWMNPFVWIYSGLVRQNHENLADEEALQSTSDPAGYRAALLNQVFNTRLISLSNSFNFSFYTNRFEMMKKNTSSPYRKLKLLLVLPLMVGMLFAFTSPRYVYAKATSTSELTNSQPAPLIQNTVRGVVYREDGTLFQGVSVAVSGTTIMTITGTDGRFEFRSIPENVILLFTHKGYKYLPLKPQFANEMSVKMIPDPDYVDPASIRPDPGRKMPVVVVNGVITDENEGSVMQRMKDDLGAYTPLNPEEAVKKYGDRAAAGAVEYWSVKRAREMGVDVPLRRKSEEDFPTFEGNSYLAFNDWVVSRTAYPEEALREGISGWARVSYTIDIDGTINDIEPNAATNAILGNALVEVIRTSSKWTPPSNPEMNEPFTAEVVVKFTLPDIVQSGEIYPVVDEMPKYPGGDQALLSYTYENLKHPPEALAQGIQGRVILRFVVTTEGKVEDISVVRSLHPLLDEEAKRVLAGVADWTPGKQEGKPVDVYYAIPINFSPK
ncbi:MAG: TonB family protein [Bacteroidales bacterium]|nr:TonB family protein [Bacteroidales bacterium]MDT8373655.1 TonB family protein [Bacteroidales bacterium]